MCVIAYTEWPTQPEVLPYWVGRRSEQVKAIMGCLKFVLGCTCSSVEVFNVKLIDEEANQLPADPDFFNIFPSAVIQVCKTFTKRTVSALDPDCEMMLGEMRGPDPNNKCKVLVKVDQTGSHFCPKDVSVGVILKPQPIEEENTAPPPVSEKPSETGSTKPPASDIDSCKSTMGSKSEQAPSHLSEMTCHSVQAPPSGAESVKIEMEEKATQSESQAWVFVHCEEVGTVLFCINYFVGTPMISKKKHTHSFIIVATMH